ncbi:esterase [Rhodobacteraceae bacterium WD3A24]|nr:esterase [Rhodobacteraceae bacterium WD3A24]
MARFLLVHGSCNGAWCWRDILPRLEAAGHAARAIDLPGHGADRTPPAEVTLDGYAGAIVDAITEPAIVVGHSMAGIPIARAAEMAPEKVEKLIFLCAYLPRDGQSVVEMRKASPGQPMSGAAVPAPDGLSFTLDPDRAVETFYHDCPEEAQAYALARVGPQPVAPQETPAALGAGFDSVEKHYILCEHDRAIPPDYQRAMAARLPDGPTSVLPTGHSPFFAAPDMLAQSLATIAESP